MEQAIRCIRRDFAKPHPFEIAGRGGDLIPHWPRGEKRHPADQAGGRLRLGLTFCAALLSSWILAAGPLAAQDALFTPGKFFGENDRFVGTTVFHWFTSTGGQQSGPWPPVEGRSNWTGRPDFWERQIKDMMDSLIDVIHVIIIPHMEEERINLFIALANLRAQGYDVPKFVPFLDSVITWTIRPPIDLATAAGKDEFVGQYIRAFEQYFSVNSDPFAESYLLHIRKNAADRVALNVWHTLPEYTANIARLSRSDVESRLAARFGATYPTFFNGVYQFCTPSNPAPAFCDEDIHQFSFMDYLVTTEHNGRKTASLMPGYWDQNIRNPGTFLARDGGVHYAEAWDCLQNIRAGGTYVSCPGFDVSDWFAPPTYHLHIVSWNEYDEGSGLYASDPGPPFIIPPNPNDDVFSNNNDPREYIDTTAQGASVFTGLAARDARILRHGLPVSMFPGQALEVEMVVRNEGCAEWTGAGGYKLGQKELLDPVLFGPGRYLIDDGDHEIPVFGGIFRGRPIRFDLQLTAPEAPGIYGLHFQMVQEHVTWFGELLEWQIEVVPATTHPSPPNGAVGVYPTTVLSWTGGPGAVGHSVYLGTDQNSVANAGRESPEFRGTLAGGIQAFRPAEPLAQGTRHFWRVDALQPDGTAITGEVWSFTTLTVAGDLDEDADVDQEDFGLLQACLSGFGTGVSSGCERADLTGDGMIDRNDLDLFQGCKSGALQPVPPTCFR